MKGATTLFLIAMALACAASATKLGKRFERSYSSAPPPYPGKCPHLFSSAETCQTKHGKADSWYLDDSRRCSLTSREYIVEPLERACEAIWNYITQTAECNFWFVTRAYVLEVMRQGCFLQSNHQGEPQYVLDDDTVVEMLNLIRTNDHCTYKTNETLDVKDWQGDLLNHSDYDTCVPLVTDPCPSCTSPDQATATTVRSMIAAGFEEQLSARSTNYCKNNSNCSNYDSKDFWKGGTRCEMCCPPSCTGSGTEFLKICCSQSKATQACNCTKNNPGSACGC